MLKSPTSLTFSDLNRLTSEEAVRLLRDLLWAEADRANIGKNLISVPSAITVADGGIDADIQAVTVASGQGVITAGSTYYQVKTGDFNLAQDSNVRDILCKPAKAGEKRELNTRVRSCFDKNGTLVVVLFGWDGPEKSDGQLVAKFKDELLKLDSSYTTSKIEIWRPNQIIGYLEPYLALRLAVLGVKGFPFLTHDAWSRGQDMSLAWHMGPNQAILIDSIREALREPKRPAHVRIIGEPGIGKTRAVLEATRQPDLAPLVVYFPDPKEVLDSEVALQILARESDGTILVVDECDQDSMSKLWNRFGLAPSPIRLVTINSDTLRRTGTTAFLEQTPLPDDQIAEIIAGYGFKVDDIRRWIPFCSGSPRVAHVLGLNLKHNPDDLLQSPDSFPLWERYLTAGDNPNSEAVENRRKVLLWLSLFLRFGYGNRYEHEAQQIAKKIEVQEGIRWAEFQRVVADLRSRKILQGDSTLYITPRLLHIWLWTQWWNTHGASGRFDLESFRVLNPSEDPPEMLGEELVVWFKEMFRYAQGSEAASRVTRYLLSSDGPFDFAYLNTDEGAPFFLSLAEADPRAALGLLKRVLGYLTATELQRLVAGRRASVNALEMASVWRELFSDAARMLLALAEAENETWTNNASGIFVNLFSPAMGAVAPTEASPEERFPILHEALWSDKPARRLIGIRACDVALTTQHFSRAVGSEFQGLRRQPQFWQPATWGEFFDSYRRVWQALAERIDTLPDEERAEAIRVLLDNARGMTRFENIATMVTDTLKDFANKPYADLRRLVDTVVSVLHYEGKTLPPATREAWEQLRDSLIGTDYHSQLQRFAGMALLEDNFDADSNHADQAQPKLEELAAESLSNPDLLLPELSWLMSGKAERGYQFGYELGVRDTKFVLFSNIMAAQRAAGTTSVFFLSGYLRALRERNVDGWEDILDQLALDEDLCATIPELSWRSGILSDRAAERILRLSKDEVFEVANFRMFTLGRPVSELSEPVFLQWIDHLSSSTETIITVPIALDLWATYYLRNRDARRMPTTVTLALLTHPAFFELPPPTGHGTMTRHYWTKLATRFTEENPDKGTILAFKILEHMGDDRAITSGFMSETKEVLTQIAKQDPVSVWRKIIQLIGPPIDTRAFEIGRWLHGESQFENSASGVLETFPSNLLWEWVDADVEKRAWYLANFVPKALFHSADRVCLAREVLARYGNREDVRNEMSANLFSGGWMGSASLHYEAVKREIQAFGAEDNDANVLRWVDEFVAELDHYIENERAREERGF